MHKINTSMTEGPLFGRMMLYTIPIILTGILQLFFNAADLAIVGRFGESESDAVAAVGCTAAISGLITNFFIGCSAGSGVPTLTPSGRITIKRSTKPYIPLFLLRPSAERLFP